MIHYLPPFYSSAQPQIDFFLHFLSYYIKIFLAISPLICCTCVWGAGWQELVQQLEQARLHNAVGLQRQLLQFNSNSASPPNMSQQLMSVRTIFQALILLALLVQMYKYWHKWIYIQTTQAPEALPSAWFNIKLIIIIIYVYLFIYLSIYISIYIYQPFVLGIRC